MSHMKIYTQMLRMLCAYFKQKLETDNDLVEKLNSLNSDNENEINNFLKDFEFSEEPKKNGKLSKNYLENRKLAFDQFFMADDRVNSFSQTLNAIYENEVTKSYQFKAFIDKLMKLIGFYYPGLRVQV